MGELVEVKWKRSLRRKVARILWALCSGSAFILVLAVVVAIAKQWWWVIGSGLAFGGLVVVFLLVADEMIREKDARYPAAGAIQYGHARGFRTCTIAFGGDAVATVSVTVELVRVEQVGRFVELYVHREGEI